MRAFDPLAAAQRGDTSSLLNWQVYQHQAADTYKDFGKKAL